MPSSTVRPILLTRDLPRLERFYCGAFGAEPSDRFPEEGDTFYLGLRLGDSDLGLTAVADAPEAPPRVLLSIDVADVDALLPEVEALGGRVKGPANDMPWGQRVAHVEDPDGNPVNLTQTL